MSSITGVLRTQCICKTNKMLTYFVVY